MGRADLRAFGSGRRGEAPGQALARGRERLVVRHEDEAFQE